MPRTEAQKINRARKRTAQRERKAANLERRVRELEGPEGDSNPLIKTKVTLDSIRNDPRPANSNEITAPPAATLSDAVLAINNMATTLNGFMQTVDSAFQGVGSAIQELTAEVIKTNTRVATVEQAQKDGLLTVSGSSGLNTLGIMGHGESGNDQGKLAGSHEYGSLRRAESQILREEGYDLPDPDDDRIVVVGTINEDIAMKRREMIQNEINRGGGLVW